jgi:hypothetical protein
VHQPSLTFSNGPEQVSPVQPSPVSSAVTATTTNNKVVGFLLVTSWIHILSLSLPRLVQKTTKRICRPNLRDLLLIMERDKYLKRSTLLVKALNK